jgi:hypothetical protein
MVRSGGTVDLTWPTAEQYLELDRLRAAGHVVILKLDGHRDYPGALPYTAAVLGKGAGHGHDLRSAVENLLSSWCWLG